MKTPLALPLRLLLPIMLPFLAAASVANAGTVNGTLQGPSGLPVKNGTLAFGLQQAGLIVGTGSVVPLTASCYTSTDGTVVGIPNPLATVISAINYGSGALPGGIYYVETTFYAGSQETLPSPELRIQLTGAGTLTISPPVSFPPNAGGMRVYLGTASGAEQLQGQTASPTASYAQATPLISGAAPPAVNTSVCSLAFNDTIIPFSGYNVTLTSANGNAYPGWPQEWQLNGGTNGTINISNGAPLWNGTTIYPQPILAQPLNHGPQSISGSLNISGYNLVGVEALGVGTNTPSWPVDVENGAVNANGGYLYNGAAPTNHVLLGNGSYYVDSATIPASAISGLTTNYQTFEQTSSALPQEPSANFSSAFSMSDTPGAATNLDLAPTGVMAGTYSYAQVTVNAKGQITSASNGTSPGTDYYFTFTGCTISNSSNLNNCGGTVTFTVGGNTVPSFAAMPDTSYYPFCTVGNNNEYTSSFNVHGMLTTAGFSYYWTEIEANAGTSDSPTIYCHLHHN
jgi:hypothetical protein